jgi:hypothetical protein
MKNKFCSEIEKYFCKRNPTAVIELFDYWRSWASLKIEQAKLYSELHNS